MSDEEILLEYETVLAAEGKDLKECPECGYKTHRDTCPDCEINMTGDKVIDDVFSRIEKGEKIDPAELDAVLRGQQWEPVKFEGEH